MFYTNKCISGQIVSVLNRFYTFTGDLNKKCVFITLLENTLLYCLDWFWGGGFFFQELALHYGIVFYIETIMYYNKLDEKNISKTADEAKDMTSVNTLENICTFI